MKVFTRWWWWLWCIFDLRRCHDPSMSGNSHDSELYKSLILLSTGVRWYKISTYVTVSWMKTTILNTFWKKCFLFSIKSTSGHSPSLGKHQHHHCLRWNILADAALLGRWCNSISISTVVPGDWLVSEPSPPLKSFQPRANQSPNELIFH